LLIGLSVATFTSSLAKPRYTLPGFPVPAPPATHIVFVSYPESLNEGHDLEHTPGLVEPEVIVWAYPLNPGGLPTSEATALFRQPHSHDCQTDSLHPSPTNQFLIIQYNCQHHLMLQLLNLENPDQNPPPQTDSHFLSWSPDGEWFIYRQPDNQAIYLAAVDGSEAQLLDLPVGTYDALFAPDGQNLVYAASSGLDLGSEIGALNLISGEITTWYQFPKQIISYPRSSPDGQHLAYILMPDSNIPFLVGELWLADTNGQPLTLLGEVDTGHGYPPVWLSDSTSG
jgi:dipeptidyl aminopeptidase/acylaminoacyl peptidase